MNLGLFSWNILGQKVFNYLLHTLRQISSDFSELFLDMSVIVLARVVQNIGSIGRQSSVVYLHVLKYFTCHGTCGFREKQVGIVSNRSVERLVVFFNN